MIYFDTSYLVRLYFPDPGFAAVRELAATASVACCILGRAEAIAAMHRKLRERALSGPAFRTVLAEFARECEADGFLWLALSPVVIERVAMVYAKLSARVFLRGADAIHLACATENRLKEIYSNDANLLAAAPHFGIRGINII